MSRLAWALILLSAALASAQSKTIEITKSDFTKMDGIRSTSLSVFGVKLGETRKQAQVDAAFFGVALSPIQDGARNAVVFRAASGCEFVISLEDDFVSRITLRQGCISDLAGESKHLLEPEILWPSSEQRLKLLGREDKRETNDFGYGKIEQLVYEKEGVQIGNFFDGKKDSLTLHFVAPAKARS